MTTALHPFGPLENFVHTMRYLAPGEFAGCRRICTSWHEAYIGIEAYVFKPLHEQAGLRVKDGKYSYKSWVVLTETMRGSHPRVLYTKYIGDPAGPNPESTVEQIEELCEFNPDRPGMRKYKTHRASFLYPSVIRPIREGEIATLDENGRLKITMQGANAASKEKQIVVGMSITNAIELFKHPLAADQENPVFGLVNGDISDQCFACQTTPSVVFVADEVPKASRNMTWKPK